MRSITMQRTMIVSGLMLLLAAVFLGSCARTPQAVPTGFLSDYSRLRHVDDRSMRYIGPQLRNYSAFMIDPVVVFFHSQAKRDATDPQTLNRLTTYMRGALANAIKGRYTLASRPGPGVARVRVALTDLDKTAPVAKIIPIGKVAGAGLGGASMEGELLDSVTGEQIAAVVQSSPGKVVSLGGAAKWGDAEAAMDEWARRFRQRLDEAHRR